MRTWTLALMIVAMACGCLPENGHWRGVARFDHEVTVGEALYVTDPNAAVGICGVYAEGDGDKEDAMGIGLTTRFNTGPIVEAAVDLVFPGEIDLVTAPAQPFATLAFGWNIDAEQTWWAVGTGVEYHLTETVHPFASVDIFSDLGVNETARIMMGAVIDLP